MRDAYWVRQATEAERASGALLTDGVLMQRASTALAVVAADLLGSVYGSRVVLLVGSGGNGGDALFAGAQLARRGARVDAVLTSSSAHAGALADLRRSGARVHQAASDEALDAVRGAHLVLDGIAGLGGSAGLRPNALALVDEIPPSATVLAVDLPTGVDADRGAVQGDAVVADVTVTFGAYKPGLLVDPAAQHSGQVVLADIGLEPFLPLVPAAQSLDADDVAALLRRPRPTDDKYTRGVVGVLAGSEQYPGAAVLAVAGAAAAGPGMVRFAGPTDIAAAVRAAHPEAIVTDLDDSSAFDDIGRVQAWVVGPGGGTGTRSASVLRRALESDQSVLVDADGLRVLAEQPDLAALVGSRAADTVLTPHAGELARLLGVDRDVVESDRVQHALGAAERFGAVVLLKGSTTVVASPHDEPLRINPRATAWLATAGAGDVLAGVIGTQLAAGLGGVDAASAGAWLHAAAAELASQGGPVRARDVAHLVPDVVASLLDPVAGGDSES